MSAFSYDHAEDMKIPEYAYAFGRNEREAEIIKLLEEKKSSLEEFRKAGQISLVNNEQMIDRIITAINGQQNLETDLQENQKEKLMAKMAEEWLKENYPAPKPEESND